MALLVDAVDEESRGFAFRYVGANPGLPRLSSADPGLKYAALSGLVHGVGRLGKERTDLFQ
jgi:hypothetical protein